MSLLRSAPRSHLAIVLIGVTVAGLPTARAAPADPFAMALPSRDSKPPEALRASASSGVVEAMGSATYRYPIEVPPGRRGVQPSLALAYASTGALRGGVAVGWSLDLPLIERDPDFPNEVRYRSTLAGASGRLVPVAYDPGSGQRFRAEVDASFIRYEHDVGTSTWIARAPDGTRYEFNRVGSNRALLTSEVDGFGNTITYDYTYSNMNGYLEYLPTTILYTSNPGSSLAAHAKVELTYVAGEWCGGIPVGAAVDHTFGLKRIRGSQRLSEIRTSVRDTPTGSYRPVRRYVLGYDLAELACSASALRYLTHVDVTATSPQGVATAAPTVRFGYGPKRRVLPQTMQLAFPPRESGNQRGATTGLMDMNGDGFTDGVRVRTENSGCYLDWYAGRAGGLFALLPTTVKLPSAAWLLPWFDPNTESCTLAGQVAHRPDLSNTKFCFQRSVFVNYAFIDYDGDGALDIVSSLSGDHGQAGNDFAFNNNVIYSDNDPVGGSESCPAGTHPVGPQSMSVRTCGCIDASQVYDTFHGKCRAACGVGQSYDLISGCSTPTSCPHCPPPGPGGGPMPEGAPSCAIAPTDPQRLDGYYVWYVQRFASGAFEPLGLFSRTYSPRPLPTGGAADMMLEVDPAPSLPTLIDLDGDGYLDVIGTSPVIGPNGSRLLGRIDDAKGIYVWRGDGWGFAEEPVLWAFEPSGWNQQLQPQIGTPTGGTVVLNGRTTLSLRDVNGDGAPDLVAQQGASQHLSVAYNMPGATWNIGSNEPIHGAFSAMVPFGLASPLEQVRSEVTNWQSDGFLRGVRGSVRRFVDLDGDGTTELVVLPTNGTVTAPAVGMETYRLFGGGSSMQQAALGSEWEPIEAQVRANGRTWVRASDFVDVTGDGRPDPIAYDSSGAMNVRTDGADGVALRLLTSVDNGRGGVTRFEYAWSNDASVVTTGGAILGVRPVVARVIEAAGFGQPERRTRYRYEGPMHGKQSARDPRAPSFLGFTRVIVDGSGQQGDASVRIEKTFSYAPLLADRQGRLATELTSIASGTTFAPTRHVEHVYGAGYVGGFDSSVTFAQQRIDRTCAFGATAAGCATQAPTLTTIETWTPWAPSGFLAQLWQHTRTETRDGVAAPRYAKRAYEMRWTATDARMLPTLDERGHVATVDVVGAKTTTIYDAAALPIETRVYKDATTYATTKRQFHPSGMVSIVRRPNEVAVNHTAAEITYYDAFVVHSRGGVNQANHSLTEAYDLGTGALILRKGGGWRATATPGVYAEDQDAWTIDGFGRVLTRSDSLEPPAGSLGYDYRVVEWIAYADTEQPNRRTVTRLRDVATGQTVIDDERYDGAGRVLEQVARRQLAGQPDARTLYRYDEGGALAQLDATSPATGAPVGSYASTTFARDGLGRVISVARPDGFREELRYGGLDSMVIEQSITDGQGARTTLHKNAYGELVAVDEHVDPPVGPPPTTSYAYDGLGRMWRILDADGVTTTMGHDWRGLRTSVTRGARSWTYAYDLNGNLTTQLEPIPSGGLIGQYTSTTTYDRLNRVLTTTPAVRALSAARRLQLGLASSSGGTTASFAYDGNGMVGKPHSVQLPFGTITLAYEPNGRVARETRALTLSQGVAVTATQWVERRYDALGAPTNVKWDDGTEWRYGHDARAAVSDVTWRVPATGALINLAHYDRQTAGQPTARTSGLAAQRRDWQYDVLGRVFHDRVFATATGATFHERDYGFDGLGELRSIGGATNGLSAEMDLTYDQRHRVVTADGPGAYLAAFEYTPGGNVFRANVSGALDAPDRNVEYAYGAVDPQAVDRLNDRTTGAVVASYGYDLAGNTTSRTVGGVTRTFAFGGDGLVHEATGPEGIERYFYAPGAERIVALGPDGVKIWFGESETHYTASGVQQRRYHHVGAGEPIARAERTTPTGTHAIELQYADALSNLAVTINASNAVTSAFVYGAFGEVVGSLGSLTHRRGFNGKEHDRVSTLRHYGWRSYDPVSLRWISADPLFRFSPELARHDPQRRNLYAFSLNNPVRHTDRSGLAPAAGLTDDELVAIATDCTNERAICVNVNTGENERLAPRIFYFEGTQDLKENWFSWQPRSDAAAVNAPLHAAIKAGYHVIKITEIHQLRRAVADPYIVGLVTLTHGEDGVLSIDSGGAVTPETFDDVAVSSSLKFAVFLGCEAMERGEDWSAALGATTYGYTTVVPGAKMALDGRVDEALADFGIIERYDHQSDFRSVRDW